MATRSSLKSNNSRVIALLQRKGGCGKTTVAVHLAVEAERAGDGPVAVLDFDEQGTLTEWWNLRKHSESIAHFAVSMDTLDTAIEAIKAEGFKTIIIDSPGFQGEHTDILASVSDMIVIPMRPSPLDLWAVAPTLTRAEKGVFVFVIVAAKVNASITTQTATSLSEHGVVAPVIIGDRTAFATTMTDGHTIQEIYPRSKGAEEISKLWKYLSTRLRKARKDTEIEKA